MSAAAAAPPRVHIIESFQALIRLIDAASTQPDDNFDAVRMCVKQMPEDHIRDVLLQAANEIAVQKRSKALFTYLVAKKNADAAHASWRAEDHA
jgi:P pilus assembly chaperone PapD